MDKSNVIYLIREKYEPDENGIYRATELKRKVYANIRSATYSEWFEGGRSGLNPTYRITVFGPDYHDEEVLEYGGKRYDIYRTYQTNNDDLELHVQYKEGTSDGDPQ